MTKTTRLLAVAISFALVACQTPKDPAANVSDPYASNYNDGFYNPYPGQGGAMQPSSSQPTYQQPPAPAEPAAPQPPTNPYAFAGASKPSPSTSKPVASNSSSMKKPVTPSSKSKSKSTSSKKSSSGSRYTVSKGDTLYGIALKKKTTVARIKAANGLSSDLIRPGQSLKIP